ncbi:MAG TPA: diadenosine tetraphosphatase, partial [Acidobacteria bacterium]|nr:diadenosine tetraphosphatase [Acidobacteriota bacterium]
FPAWSLEKAQRLAREVEEGLRGDAAPDLVASIDKRTADRWRSGLSGTDRLRTALAGFVRLRTVGKDGT